MNIRSIIRTWGGAAAVFAAAALPASAADVGVSISVGQPGFYGRIDIGNAPPPQVVYPQPVVVAPPPPVVAMPAVPAEPLYLRVPPGHQRHWKKFCARYNACDRPVYFVQERWYNDVYVPHYRDHRDEYREHGRGDDRRGQEDDRHGRGEERGEGRGRGEGHGEGHGRGRDRD
jgi:hypothetical protein